MRLRPIRSSIDAANLMTGEDPTISMDDNEVKQASKPKKESRNASDKPKPAAHYIHDVVKKIEMNGMRERRI